MRHVAERAGVSYQTVSRVVNDADGVAAPTRERVRAAMRELNYRPSLAARSLATNRTEAIGLVMPFSVDFTFADAHLLQIVGGVSREVSESDHSLLLSSPNESEGPLSAFRRLVRHRSVDGVIVETGIGDAGITMLRDAGYPVVVIGYSRMDVPMVRPDDSNGAYVVMQHLLALGHRRIGLISGPVETNLGVVARREGCERALADAGRRLRDDLVVAGDFTIESGYEAAKQLSLRPEPPTALFAFNDAMAIGAMQYLRENGIDVPGQMSVAGFDDIPSARLLTPSLTSVRVFSAELGQRAARLLVGILRGTPVATTPTVLPSQLIVRSSTAPVGGRGDE
jgi:DNA-binding LacI/PurR family transcriptional regulator